MEKNPEELKQSYIDRMGEDLGSIFYRLMGDLLNIYLIWNEYVELFVERGEKKSIGLLNEVAPSFFYFVQNSFWAVICMGFSRLTDPPVVSGKKTVSIFCLPDMVKGIKDFEKLVSSAESKVKFAREQRNKNFAHTDLKSVIYNVNKPEPGDIDKVYGGLEAIAKVLNAVEKHYNLGYTNFNITYRYDGALSLIKALENGLNLKNTYRK